MLNEVQKSAAMKVFMKSACSDWSICYIHKAMPEILEEVAKLKNVPIECILKQAITALTEDGVANEFVMNMIVMWRDGTRDNVEFTARDAMLYQHIAWTNVEHRDYMTNSLRVNLQEGVG